jgi:hypothetical protein
VNTQDIMEETPEGPNSGVSHGAYVDEQGSPRRTRNHLNMRLAKLDQRGLETVGSRYGVVSGKEDGGLVAHRGVLHPDEYVDPLALSLAVRAELGVSIFDIGFAYKMGRPTAEQRQLRDEIDSRLLALSRAGGNMTQAAQAFGISEKTVDRALTRAKSVEVVPIVRDPAVRTVRPCFVCSEPGVARKRLRSTSPEEYRGSVVLCGDHYLQGFDERPGNPAYWEFRDDKRIPKYGGNPVSKPTQTFPADWPSDASYDAFVAGERVVA